MRRFFARLLLFVISSSLLLAQHQAESGHGAEGSSNELLWKWANFAILTGALGYLVYKHAGAFFRGRTDAIRKDIEEANRLRQEAEARASQMEQRLKNLEAEVKQLRVKAGTEMEAESLRLRRETEETLRKVREQANQEIASAVKAARHEVRAHAAEIAVKLAAGKVRAMLSPQADQALVASFLSDVEKQTADSGKEVN